MLPRLARALLLLVLSTVALAALPPATSVREPAAVPAVWLPDGRSPGDRATAGEAAGPGFGAAAVHAQVGLPPLPAGWPVGLALGVADGPGGAAALRAKAPFGYRYQYLAGGVNTGAGWATWNPNGDFVRYYVEESVAQGIVPVFSYYMLYQSLPGGPGGEQAAVLANLANAATMRAYADDLRLFFQQAGAFPGRRIILQVEPDLWGYVQQVAAGDNAGAVPARVAAAAPEWAGLPDTVAGLARGVARLRDQHAPNVQLAYHLSVWGTGVDVSLADPPDAQVDALGDRAAAFYRSLGAPFDLAFGEFSDRDSGFKRAIYGLGPEAWWDAGDFRRFARFLGRFVAGSGTRVVLWQVPLGNTRMRAANDTWNHYQDNRVEWLLDEPARTHLTEYAQAGVIGLLFGRGADGATCACDAAGDGVTDPPPINGNTAVSLSADDDGGFFHGRAAAYYRTGPLTLPGAGPSPTATPTPTPAATPTPTQPPTATATMPPVACSPRPPVRITSQPSGGGLLVTVSATGANNRLLRLQVTRTSNALVDVGGQTGRTGVFTVTLSGATASTTFLLRRASGSGAATVAFGAVDRCGTWTTFVGGGPDAF